MNKTAIKNYAIWARVQLIESAKQRAFEYAITDGENDPNMEIINGRILSADEKSQRAELISLIKQKGFDQVMEEAAYTWFNRFIAFRFMEVNGYLPSKVRVFTDENGEFKPQILKEAMTVELDVIDRDYVISLLDKQDMEALYKYLIITQCNALNEGLPYMFEKINNWTELLFPANLLRGDSVLGKMISDIPADDWTDEVEIIGWLYQYYISEKHEEVVDPLHGKVVKKEDIPAATQLFTTDWVVRYIIDNSLGRYWIERHPESKLADKLVYFVTPKDGVIPTVNEVIGPEELKVLDPCVGSGHFLSYAFDVLLEIYRECGWSDRDAAKSILENNLYGLDIDDRAAQLAYFSVMMKARKYNRRIIDNDVRVNVLAMQDSDFITDQLIKYVARGDASVRNDLNELKIVFNNAKEYGSLITVPDVDYGRLYSRIDEVENGYLDNILEVQYRSETIELLLSLMRQAEILSLKYDVVATNPPYMNKYSPRLKAFITEKYEAYKGDLFSVFMYRNFGFCKTNGYSGFMTPMVWMFIKSYEELRQFIIEQKSIATLIQFEYSAFEEATVPICSFVLKNGVEDTKGLYFKLSSFRGGMDVQRIKVEEAINNRSCGYYYEAEEKNYSMIPGTPIAYWVSEGFMNVFKTARTLDCFADCCTGMQTGDNERFIRNWYEVSSCDFFSEAKNEKGKWIKYNCGGDSRKWFGNHNKVVLWDNKGEAIRSEKSSVVRNSSYYFKKGITWKRIGSSDFFMRYLPEGFIFDQAGDSMFITDDNLLLYILGFVNTKVAFEAFKMIAPTLNLTAGNLNKLPIVVADAEDNNNEIKGLVSECIVYEKTDWDSFETSWDFKKHPLI